MTIERRLVLRSVRVITDPYRVAEVEWSDQIVEDGVVTHAKRWNRAYEESEVESFVKEVEGAHLYLPVLGWKLPETSSDTAGEIPNEVPVEAPGETPTETL